MTVREMTWDDIDAVLPIEEANFPEAWNANGFLTHLLREDALYLVAEEEDSVTGYIGMIMVPDEADITKVSVDQSRQRRGIGSALMAELLRLAPEHGVAHIFLEVRKSNAPAIGLYRKYGFETVGERKDYYTDPVEDALTMKRSL